MDLCMTESTAQLVSMRIFSLVPKIVQMHEHHNSLDKAANVVILVSRVLT